MPKKRGLAIIKQKLTQTQNYKPMALLIKTNGEVKEVYPSNKKHFSLEELQKFVGGYIEIVYVNDNHLFVCNEEGLLHNLPQNKLANESYDFIVRTYAKCSLAEKQLMIDKISFRGDVLKCPLKAIE